MRKTSVYLPDDLKQGLSALADRWERSEAELLRLAVERLVRSAAHDAAPTAAPRARLVGPCLVGVGVGPGDPELVTERAVRVLASADRVFTAATGPDAIGRAEAVVRTVAPEVRVERLALDDGADPEARRSSLQRVAATIVDALDQGVSAAFAVLGDPSTFSTFSPVADLVARARPAVPISAVPGVMAFQDLAAQTRTVLAADAERIAILVADDDTATLDAALADPRCTVVVYKGGRHLPAVAGRLDAHGRMRGAVIGELLGVPGARCVEVESVADQAASYLATVVVPASRPARVVISFVGAGPGAADLITLRGAARLAAADVVVWAASLVPEAMLAHCRPGVEVHDSKTMTLEAVTAVYEQHPDAAIVRLHSGDPTVYSAIGEQIDWCVERERDFEIVPGVSSMSAAAAAIGRELTAPGVAQSVVLTRLAHRTAASMPEHEGVAAFARVGGTMALFLSAGRPDELQDELLTIGSQHRDATPAVIASRVSWPDERIVHTTVGHLAESLHELGARTTVLVLVGDALGSGPVAARSHVYAPDYAHSFRKRASSADG